MVGGGHIMVGIGAVQDYCEDGRYHLAADVHAAVDRRDREIGALGAGAMTKIAAFIGLAGAGRQLDVIAGILAGRIAVFELYVVKHEQTRYRSDINGVAEANGLHIGFSALARLVRTPSFTFAS